MSRTLDQLPKGWGDHHIIVPLAELKELGEWRGDILDLSPALRRAFDRFGFWTVGLEHPVGITHKKIRYVQTSSFATPWYPRFHLLPQDIRPMRVVRIGKTPFMLLGLAGHVDVSVHCTDHSRKDEALLLLKQIRDWFQERFLEGGPCLMSNVTL